MHRRTYPNQKMVAKLAWSFHHTTGIEFEELHSEAKLAYYEALQMYQEGHDTKVTSWCYTVITSRLLNFIAKESKNSFESIDNIVTGRIYNQHTRFEIAEEFTGNEKVIFNLIFSDPAKYAEGKQAAKRILSEELRQQGWTWSMINDSMRAMKTIINLL